MESTSAERLLRGERLGNLKDKFDAKDEPLFTTDQLVALTARTSSSSGGTSVILEDLPPVYDQGHIGSCTANATLAALRYAWKKKHPDKTYEDWNPSRLFLYHKARVRNDPQFSEKVPDDPQKRVSHDSGSHNRCCIVTLTIDGVCSEDLWPYGDPDSDSNTDEFKKLDDIPNPCEPKDLSTAEYQARGSTHPASGSQESFIPREISFYRIFDPAEASKYQDQSKDYGPWRWDTHPPIAALEQTIRDGYPFIFGIQFFKSATLCTTYKADENDNWLRDENGRRIMARSDVSADGVFNMPPTQDFTTDGNHALMAVGFDPSKRQFLIQNSWGTTDWPPRCAETMQGKVWIPYEWFEASYTWTAKNSGTVYTDPICYDFWVIKYGE